MCVTVGQNLGVVLITGIRAAARAPSLASSSSSITRRWRRPPPVDGDERLAGALGMYVLEKKRCESFAVDEAGGEKSEKNMAAQSSQVIGD